MMLAHKSGVFDGRNGRTIQKRGGCWSIPSIAHTVSPSSRRQRRSNHGDNIDDGLRISKRSLRMAEWTHDDKTIEACIMKNQWSRRVPSTSSPG